MAEKKIARTKRGTKGATRHTVRRGEKPVDADIRRAAERAGIAEPDRGIEQRDPTERIELELDSLNECIRDIDDGINGVLEGMTILESRGGYVPDVTHALTRLYSAKAYLRSEAGLEGGAS